MFRCEVKEFIIELFIFIIFMIPALLFFWLITYIDNRENSFIEDENLSSVEDAFHKYSLEKDKTNYEVLHPNLKTE